MSLPHSQLPETGHTETRPQRWQAAGEGCVWKRKQGSWNRHSKLPSHKSLQGIFFFFSTYASLENIGTMKAHLRNQIIGQSAHVFPGPSFKEIHLGVHGNRQKLHAEDLFIQVCRLIVGVADGAHLPRPGLPGQPTQRLCVTDIIGLLHQRPAVRPCLRGGQANSGHDRHTEHIIDDLGHLTCSSMFHTATEPSQLAEAWNREQLLICCFVLV